MKSRNVLIAVIIVILVVAFLIYRSNGAGRASRYVPSQPSSATTTSAAQGSYTLAEVAKHKDSSSCWTAVSGGVYDLTTWINQHPGGPEAILTICGKDGTSAFLAQHGGQRRPEAELATFKIGALAP